MPVAPVENMPDEERRCYAKLRHPVERHRRDLQFYLRQANPDGLGDAALRWLREGREAARWSLA